MLVRKEGVCDSSILQLLVTSRFSETHLGWPDDVGLGPWIVLPGANLGRLVQFFQKEQMSRFYAVHAHEKKEKHIQVFCVFIMKREKKDFDDELILDRSVLIMMQCNDSIRYQVWVLVRYPNGVHMQFTSGIIETWCSIILLVFCRICTQQGLRIFGNVCVGVRVYDVGK